MTHDREENTENRKSRLALRLTLVFLLALVMGPGPGAYLIDPDKVFTCLDFPIPALYAWLVFWFLVMAVVILAAAVNLWADEDEGGVEE